MLNKVIIHEFRFEYGEERNYLYLHFISIKI